MRESAEMHAGTSEDMKISREEGGKYRVLLSQLLSHTKSHCVMSLSDTPPTLLQVLISNVRQEAERLASFLLHPRPHRRGGLERNSLPSHVFPGLVTVNILQILISCDGHLGVGGWVWGGGGW